VAWSYDTLARFARHYKTGEVIPESLVDNMRRADKFGLGTMTCSRSSTRRCRSTCIAQI